MKSKILITLILASLLLTGCSLFPSKNTNTQMSNANAQQPSFTEIPTQPSFQQPVQQQSDMKKDIELLSTKLDALRSSIELINQRLQTIEGLIRGEVEEKKKTWRYG